MEDVNLKDVGKGELDEAILNANLKEIREEMEKCEQLKDVKNEEFRKKQTYLMEKSVQTGLGGGAGLYL